MLMKVLWNVLQADIVTDAIIFRHLCGSGCVEMISSEEFPEVRSGGGKGFSVSDIYWTANHPAKSSQTEAICMDCIDHLHLEHVSDQYIPFCLSLICTL